MRLCTTTRRPWRRPHACSGDGAAAQRVPASLSAKLPLAFKTLGLSVHQDFDHIALDAESLADHAHTLDQIGRLLGKCVACHGAYQIAPASSPPATR